MIVNIDDPDDERLAPYRNIKERDLVKNRKQFIAEGKTVLNVLAAQNRFGLQSLLILENRLNGMTTLVKSLDKDVPVYVASKQVMNAVAGFPMHRGVLGIGLAPDGISVPPNETHEWKRIVVMVGLSNHDNVGSIFRNAAALGVDAILIDAQTCDPLYRKAIRVSVGGVFKVPYFEFENAMAIIAWLREHKFETVALSPQGTTALSDWRPAPKSALILGTEGAGLPQNLLENLTTMQVEMADDFDSLNVATTSGIVLHHLYIHQGAHNATTIPG